MAVLDNIKPEYRFAKKTKFNEYYTTYSMAEDVFRPIISYFDGKKVCCPCDGRESNIVKWLQDNTSCKVIYFDCLDMNGKEALSYNEDLRLCYNKPAV